MSGRDERSGEGPPPQAAHRRRAARLAALEQVELEVEKLVEGGLGLGRVDGIPILVPRSAPGDRVRARLVERRPDYGRAEIVELLRPGAERRDPPCPYFARCGGCDLQHLEDRAQVRLKVEAAVETLRRLGGVELDAEPVVHVAEAWAYRARAQFQIDRDAAGPRVGYFARASHEVVAVARCPILAPELDEELASLGRRLGEAPPRRLDAAVGSDGRVGFAPVVEGLPHGELVLRVGPAELGFDARCFVQAHRGLIETLVTEAVENGPPPASEGQVFDLYAGIGLFSVPLARRHGRVVAVEADRVAAHHARRNFKRNRVAGEAVHQRVERWIERLPESPPLVLVDPPRSGLPGVVSDRLLERAPRWLTYVSCQPATLARDLRRMSSRYRIRRLAFLDLFPQTGHIETVIQLELEGA